MFNCEWIPVKRGADKICHFLVGVLIVVSITLLIDDEIIALSSMASVAVGKELYDYFSYGHYSFFDMFATLLGGVLGLMGLHVVQLLIA